MSKSNKKLGLIFDLDGTLWDATNELLDSYNHTMERLNLKYKFTIDDVFSYMGLTPEETIKLIFKDLPYERGKELFDTIIEDEIKYLRSNPGKLYKNEKEVLAELSKNYSLFIVSNASKGYIENYLDGHNMNQYFTDHICAGDTLKDKHENIKLIVQKHKLKKFIYVGDTLKDKNECDKINAMFVHANYGFGKINGYKFKINSLSELPDFVKKLF